MSFDLLTLPRACDHLIASERLLIAEDHRHLYSFDHPTMRMPGPVNGASTVILRINDVPVPRNHPVYGWELLPDELSVAPDLRSKIVFKRQVRLRELRIEASYVTTSPYCHKCGGTGAVVDLEVGPMGSYRHVTKRQKLIQRCMKFLLTSVCSFYPGLVCGLRDFIGKKYGASVDSDSVSYEIISSLDALQAIQQAQSRYQTLDPEEILKSVGSVLSTRDSSDPSIIRVKVEVASTGGTSDTLNVGLRASS